LKILLLAPNDSSTNNRATSYLEDGAHNVAKNEQEYSDNILKCLQNIAAAKKKNSRVQVRLLKTTPTWKIVKVDREVWAQPIISGFRSDHTTMYGYKNKPHSMYHVFFNKIEDLWHRADVINIDDYGPKSPITESDNTKASILAVQSSVQVTTEKK